MEAAKLCLLVLSVWLSLVQAEQQDVGRAKAKISAEEMLKLHRKRRDDDKLFSINSPRKNEAKQVRNFDKKPNTFTHKFFDNFSREIKVVNSLKSPNLQHFHEFFTPQKNDYFFGKS